MPTECSPNLFDFARVEGRSVTASFDGGAISSDAGALLLGAADRALGLTRRLAACFKDHRDPTCTEHTVETLAMQRVAGIALGYEDLNDHDQLRHDPVMAVLAGKLSAHRSDCAPLAGKSTLDRLELSRLVRRTRARWPRVRILLRADSGFCREPIMAWAEANRTAGGAMQRSLEERLARRYGVVMSEPCISRSSLLRFLRLHRHAEMVERPHAP